MAEAFSALFERAQSGDSLARDAVYRLAFYRLRGIASALLSRERPGHTLQPTALVSELFLKIRRLETTILNEDHFFRISARAMRQVLIDHSRVAGPKKKIAPGQIPELLTCGPSRQHEDSLAVKLCFDRLRRMDSQVAETVWLRCVEGATVTETARVQAREEWRVRADYDFGLQWMANRLKRYSS